MKSDPNENQLAPAENIPPVSERQTADWDLKNAVHNYSALVIAQVAGAFFSFASVWLVTHTLGTEGYGGVVAVIAASQLVQMFVVWTNVSLTRFGVQEFVERGTINKSFWARTAIFLPNTLLMLALSFQWVPVLSSWLKLPPETGWYVAGHFLVTVAWFHMQYALQAAKLAKIQGILLAVERILIFGVLGLLAGVGRLDYLGALAAYVAGPLAMIFAGLFYVRKVISWRIELDAGWFKQMLKFSIPLIPYTLVGYFFTNYLDVIFISQYLTKSDVGIYSVAYQINGIFMQFPMLAGTVLTPLFITLYTKKNIDKVNIYMSKVLPILTLAGGVAGVTGVFVTKFFISFLFGVEVLPALLILWILISCTAFALPTFLGYAPYTTSHSATYISLAMSVAAALTNLGFNILLIPRYGLKGSAWATLMAYVVSFAVISALVKIKFSVRFSWIIPALLPALSGSIVASWTGNTYIAFAVTLLAAILVVLVYRKPFTEGVRYLLNYRALLAREN